MHESGLVLDAPVVSVIIPTFRREELVVRAVRSVLERCTLDLEVLVVDDSAEASAKEAIAAIDDRRVRYSVMETPSSGRPALVRNTAIERARGKYLYFLDDDQTSPGGIEALVAALEAKPGKGVAFGRVNCIGPDKAIRDRYNTWFNWAGSVARRLRWSSRLTVGVIMFRGSLIVNSTCMMRREVAKALGGYDASIPLYEDVEFYARGMRRFGHVFVDAEVLTYNTGEPSLINDLHDDWSQVRESYEIMHNKYRQLHGTVEYRLLQVVSKLLPLRTPTAAG